jgi:hypothetical protein
MSLVGQKHALPHRNSTARFTSVSRYAAEALDLDQARDVSGLVLRQGMLQCPVTALQPTPPVLS